MIGQKPLAIFGIHEATDRGLMRECLFWRMVRAVQRKCRAVESLLFFAGQPFLNIGQVISRPPTCQGSTNSSFVAEMKFDGNASTEQQRYGQKNQADPKPITTSQNRSGWLLPAAIPSLFSSPAHSGLFLCSVFADAGVFGSLAFVARCEVEFESKVLGLGVGFGAHLHHKVVTVAGRERRLALQGVARLLEFNLALPLLRIGENDYDLLPNGNGLQVVAEEADGHAAILLHEEFCMGFSFEKTAAIRAALVFVGVFGLVTCLIGSDRSEGQPGEKRGGHREDAEQFVHMFFSVTGFPATPMVAACLHPKTRALDRGEAF